MICLWAYCQTCKHTQCFVFLSILFCLWDSLPISTCSTAPLSNLSIFIVALLQTHSTIFKTAIYIRELWRRVNVTTVFFMGKHHILRLILMALYLDWVRFSFFRVSVDELTVQWAAQCTAVPHRAWITAWRVSVGQNTQSTADLPEHEVSIFLIGQMKGKKAQGNLKWWPEAWYIQ